MNANEAMNALNEILDNRDLWADDPIKQSKAIGSIKHLVFMSLLEIQVAENVGRVVELDKFVSDRLRNFRAELTTDSDMGQ